MQDFSESQKRFIKDLFDKLNNTINEKTEGIREELKVQISKINGEFAETVGQLQQKIKEVETKNEELHKNIIYLERRSRKNNIVVFGIGKEEQNLLECTINIFTNILELDICATDLSDVYRITTKNSGKHPVIVEFVSFQKKLLVLNNARKLKGKNIYIARDQCAEDREQSKILIDHQRRARANGQKAYIKKGKLYVNENEVSVEQIRESKEIYEDSEEDQEEYTARELGDIRTYGKGRDKKRVKSGTSKEQKSTENKIQTRSVIGTKK